MINYLRLVIYNLILVSLNINIHTSNYNVDLYNKYNIHNSNQ